jgi:hypothetical protein
MPNRPYAVEAGGLRDRMTRGNGGRTRGGWAVVGGRDCTSRGRGDLSYKEQAADKGPGRTSCGGG